MIAFEERFSRMTEMSQYIGVRILATVSMIIHHEFELKF